MCLLKGTGIQQTAASSLMATLVFATFALLLFRLSQHHFLFVETPDNQPQRDAGIQLELSSLNSVVGGEQEVVNEVQRTLQLDETTLFAFLFSAIVSAMANSAGVGGGAFFVPLFNVVAGFSIKMSTALSQAAITGGALGSAAYTLSSRHPQDPHSTLIDFQLALLLTPPCCWGVLLNAMFPSWIITLSLICLLCYLTARTLGAGRRLQRAEARLLDQPSVQGVGVVAVLHGDTVGGGSEELPLLAGMAKGRSWAVVGSGCDGSAGLLCTPRATGQGVLGSGSYQAAVTPKKVGGGEGEDGSCQESARMAEREEVLPPHTPHTSPHYPAPQEAIVSSRRDCSTGSSSLLEDRGQHEHSVLFAHSTASVGGPVAWRKSFRVVKPTPEPPPSPAVDRPGRGEAALKLEPPPSDATVSLQSANHPPAALKPLPSPFQSPGVLPPAKPPHQAQLAQHGSNAPGASPPPSPAPGPSCGTGAAGSMDIEGGPGLQESGYQQRFPWGSLAALGALWVGFLGFQLAKAPLSRCSAAFVGVYLAQALVSLAATSASAGRLLRREHRGEAWQAAFQQLPDGDVGPAGGRGLVEGTSGQHLQSEGAGCSTGTACAGSSPPPPPSTPAQLWEYHHSPQVQTPVRREEGPGRGSSGVVQRGAAWHSAAGSGPVEEADRSVAKSPTAFPPAYSSGSRGARLTLALPPTKCVDFAQIRGFSRRDPPSLRPSGPSSYGGEGVWTGRRLAVTLCVTVAGGAVAGLVGIGGGMIVGPLMLELGVHPQSSSATSGLMVLFSSSMAALSFAAAGRLNPHYAAAFGCVCMGAAVLGVTVVGAVVKRSGRASLVVMMLAGIMGLGALLTAAYAGSRAVLDLVHGRNLGFGALCAR